jgi:enoyl-CoA hydratase
MAGKIHYDKAGEVAIFQMDDGKANTIELTFLDELAQALAQAKADRARAILFRGRPGFFSAGLDLKVLPTYGSDGLREFARRYEAAKTGLFQLGLPVVADVSGHALAGGAVLLLCCDAAIGDPGPKRIGLNETQIGITLPRFVTAMATARLAVPHWTRALAAGEIYDPEGALAAGFLSEIAPDARAREERALAEATRLAKLPTSCYRAVKAQLRDPVIAALEASAEASTISAFFDRP